MDGSMFLISFYCSPFPRYRLGFKYQGRVAGACARGLENILALQGRYLLVECFLALQGLPR